MQTFVFEARESFKFKSVFMLLFFFSVFFFFYRMGHFLSITKIQNYYLTLVIKKLIYCNFQSCMKNVISIRNI